MNHVMQRGTRAFVQLRQMSSAPAKQGVVLDGKSLTAQTKFGPMSEKVKRAQRHFQDPLNDKPVYLQGGKGDVLLFAATLALVGGGLVNCGKRAYERLTGQQ